MREPCNKVITNLAMVYQNFTIGDVVCKGISPCEWRWKAYKLPTEFNGRSVLDIGTWEGFFAFEATRRGAKNVCAIDYTAWKRHPDSFVQFCENAKKLAPCLRYELKDVCTLTPAFGQFDVVLLLQVLYHVRDPFMAIRGAASVCKQDLWIETMVLGEEDSLPCFWPVMTDDPYPVFWPSQQAVIKTVD